MPARKVNLTEPVEVEKDVTDTAGEQIDPVFEEDKPATEAQEIPDEPVVEPESEDTPEPDEPEDDEPAEWWPGRPCLNCGKTGYRVATGWGTWCDRCDEVEDEED